MFALPALAYLQIAFSIVLFHLLVKVSTAERVLAFIKEKIARNVNGSFVEMRGGG